MKKNLENQQKNTLNRENKVKYLILILCISTSLHFSFAQDCGKSLPFWATDHYRIESDNSYIETIIVVTEVTTDMMRAKAREIVAEKHFLATGERIIFSESETLTQRELTVLAREIQCCFDYEKEIGYFLVQVLKSPSTKFEEVQISDKYKFSARVFVPGMAQIYKGSTTKGGLIIAGEALFVGGIVASEVMRAQYNVKINATKNATLKQRYMNNAHTCEIIRNISIGGFALIYAYNIIDGCVAKGKPHILVGGKSLAFMPYALPNGAGVFLTLTF